MNTNANNEENTLSHRLTAFLLIAYVGVWSTLYMSIHLDVDIAWLLQCLERYIAGGTYTNDFYETNPPLSFLIYLPAYPLFTTIGLSAKFSILINFSIYILASNALLFKLLQKTSLSQSTILAICCATISAQTWGAGMNFGLKDHLILVFLTPFSLFQYLLSTSDKKINPWLGVTATIMGGIALCLKPHYAIIPVAFYIHRLVTTKSLKKCILSIDTIGLISCGAAYITFIYIFNPEFISIILPETSTLYSVETPFPISIHLKLFSITVIAAFIAFALIIATRNEEQLEIKNTIIAFSILSALCLIPYVIQNKGFFYHTTPFFGFGVAAFTMAAYGTCRLITKKKTTALLITLILVGVLTHVNTRGASSTIMNNNQFKAQPIAEFIEENAWNKVYITFDMKSMLAPLPYLIDVKNGSRFGQIWNLNALSILSSHAQNDEQSEEIKAQMMNVIDMMAEDITNNKPSVIAIPLYPTTSENNEPSEMYYQFLMANDNFEKAMQHYTKEERIPFNKSLSLNDTNGNNIIWHDMYVLKKTTTFNTEGKSTR